MGAETSSLSSQHLEDGAPLQPQLPKHESHGDGDIHEVVDRVFVSGLAGALNFPMLHQRGLTLHPPPLAPQLLATPGVSPCGAPAPAHPMRDAVRVDRLARPSTKTKTNIERHPTFLPLGDLIAVWNSTRRGDPRAQREPLRRLPARVPHA